MATIPACDGCLGPPERADQADEGAEAGRTRRRPGPVTACGFRIRGGGCRGGRRAGSSPSAMIDQSPSATVGIPMPPAASKVDDHRNRSGAEGEAGMGSRFQSGASRNAAVSQLPPRTSHREKRSA